MVNHKQLAQTKEINGTLSIGNLETISIEHFDDKIRIRMQKPHNVLKIRIRMQNPDIVHISYTYAKAVRVHKSFTTCTKAVHNVRKIFKRTQNRIKHCTNSMHMFPPKQEVE